MTNQYPIVIFLLLTIGLANLPWLSDKLFCIKIIKHKTGIVRWSEWFIWYVLSFSLGAALENKMMGTLSEQDWEFYVVTLCLFVVFALPGFIYCYDLKKILRSGK